MSYYCVVRVHGSSPGYIVLLDSKTPEMAKREARRRCEGYMKQGGSLLVADGKAPAIGELLAGAVRWTKVKP